MKLMRALVVAAVIVAAIPAAAQDGPVGTKRGNGQGQTQTRYHNVRSAGWYGRFLYGPPRYYWPVSRPGVMWVVDDYIPEGRPLGFSANAYGYSQYSRPEPGWFGWPYVSMGGRDEGPRGPGAPRVEAEAGVAEGRSRWRAGDLAGALDSFKQAVASDLRHGDAQLHMALALLVTGDPRNADKALISALELIRGPGDLARLQIDDFFRNAKARAKFEAKAVPAADGAGSLTAALAQHLLGRPAKATELLKAVAGSPAEKLAAAKLVAWLP